jgi:phosphatidylinositol-3-phosphatase
VKHNPWPYFTSGRKNCDKFDVPMGTPKHGRFARDIASGHLPDVGMAIPNLDDDAHDGSLATADHWLKGWLPSILRSHAFTSGRLAVVVTADEGKGSGPNTVLTVVLHAPGRGGLAVKSPLTHYSLSGFLSKTAHAHALRHAAHAPSFSRAFGF